MIKLKLYLSTIIFAFMLLASNVQAHSIVGITGCNCTILTFQLSGWWARPLTAKLGGIDVSSVYDSATQTLTTSRPNLAAGTYSLVVTQIAPDNTVITSTTNINLCACISTPCECPAGPIGPQGPQGIKGATGLTGLTGAIGPKGNTGSTGPQGLIGLTGPKGNTGTTGSQGPIGLTGPQGNPGVNGTNGINGATGPTGPQGIPGPSGSGSSIYAYIYNLLGQTVPIEADIPFSDNGIITAGITHAPGTTTVLFSSAGDYKITFSISGTEPNQFGIFVNNVLVAGTVYASGAGTQQNNGQAIVAISSGDVLTVRNHTSSAAVGLATPIGGTVAEVNASILIQKLN